MTVMTTTTWCTQFLDLIETLGFHEYIKDIDGYDDNKGI